MTSKEFSREMRGLYEAYGEDVEAFHIKADDLMCEALIELGYELGVKTFQEAEKWYA